MSQSAKTATIKSFLEPISLAGHLVTLKSSLRLSKMLKNNVITVILVLELLKAILMLVHLNIKLTLMHSSLSEVLSLSFKPTLISERHLM